MAERTRNISAGTVTRFVLLALALINTALNMAGVQTIPVDEEGVATFINLAFLGGASLWAYWKNNDVTRKARSK
ncbi:phage holin [Peribacillus huizhouensis]|uniref:SPP1 family holin n=1 Tax=Peribacillus huizhouensis TaxID=1501239 RepID=A0ABR6CRZ1_9BACI|nr:phage holin [Peribacillus huizhouensis]MBA9027501.1 SPP1 family holin [Peribacillus huizhouensis]